MGRVETNMILAKHFCEEALKNPKGTFEEMMSWHLGAISSFLMDISASLAVIADSMNREEGEQNE